MFIWLLKVSWPCTFPAVYKGQWASQAWYGLNDHERTEQSFWMCRCISFGPDDKGVVGLYLGTDVVQEATKALEQAMCRVRND